MSFYLYIVEEQILGSQLQDAQALYTSIGVSLTANRTTWFIKISFTIQK